MRRSVRPRQVGGMCAGSISFSQCGVARQAYTGCTETANPSGESGRPWCYVEAQVFLFCAAIERVVVVVALVKFVSVDISQLVEAGLAKPPWSYCGAVPKSFCPMIHAPLNGARALGLRSVFFVLQRQARFLIFLVVACAETFAYLCVCTVSCRL